MMLDDVGSSTKLSMDQGLPVFKLFNAETFFPSVETGEFVSETGEMMDSIEIPSLPSDVVATILNELLMVFFMVIRDKKTKELFLVPRVCNSLYENPAIPVGLQTITKGNLYYDDIKELIEERLSSDDVDVRILQVMLG
jgi:hypothetical protein